MNRFAYLVSAAALALLLAGQSTHAQVYQSCDRWAQYSTGGFTIFNNIWGSNAGSQCLWVNSASQWGINSVNHPDGGIDSYANVGKSGQSHPVDSMPSVTSSFNVSVPGSGSHTSTYDIWSGSNIEIMIWMNKYGSHEPWSHSWDAQGRPVPIASNVSVGGHTWNIYYNGAASGSHRVWSMIRTSNTNSGTVDLRACVQRLRTLSGNNSTLPNVTIDNYQFGFEISGTAGGTLSFTCNSYSLTIGSTGGGGGGGGTTYTRLRNRGTNLYADGMGRTSNGSNLGQYANTSHYNAQWTEESPSSGYYKFRNRGTGLYIDGMGRTSNGSAMGQYSGGSSYNQQFSRENPASGYYKFRNRGTGLYMDGMGRTSNGSDMGQWSSSSSNNQQFSYVAP